MLTWQEFNDGLPYAQSYPSIFGLVVKNDKLYATLNEYSIWQYDLEALPVELVSFSLSINGTSVSLSWHTVSETNNKGFIIERSKISESNGQEQWDGIGYVEGNGTTLDGHSYSFLDENLQTGKYQYRLKQIDFDGSFEFSNIIEGEVSVISQFSLEQNYPNPFNPSTNIKFSIPVKSIVSLKVYDVLGGEVETLVNGEKEAGSYNFKFNAKNVSSGIYFYKLEAGGYTSIRKMLFLK